MMENMGKILVVQSRTTPNRIEREQANFRRSIGPHADVEFLSALDERLAWHTPDEFLKLYKGVIFGGSSDFDFHGGREEGDPARLMSLMILSRTKMIISYALAEEVPILGVCFGHQLIAQMHGGDVFNDKAQKKFGSFDVQLTHSAPLDKVFGKLPQSFTAQYAHKDSVTNLPRYSTLLATGPTCKFSALRYGDAVYTVQFHPEVDRIQIPGVPTKESKEASEIIPYWIQTLVAKRA